MLGKFFNDEYATKCTRTGRGKDKTTTVGQSELLNVLKSEIVVKFNFLNIFNVFVRRIIYCFINLFFD